MLASASPGDAHPTRHRMSSEARREAIIDAAVKLFAEKGFRGTTTRELAAAVGVSEPVLYQHFQTKRDLYTAIIDRKSQEGGQRFEAKLGPYLKMNDDCGFFTVLAQLIVEYHTTDPAYIRLILFSALEGHELADICYQRQHTVFLNMIADYIRRRIGEGALRNIDPTIAAYTFIGMVAHYAQAGVIHRCGEQMAASEDVIPMMVNIFLDGMQSTSR